MRIVGIDPGSYRMGWGVLECRGSRYSHIASGTLRAPLGPLPTRLLTLHSQLADALVQYAPDIAAVETMYHAKNTQSIFVLAQARGAALLALAQKGLSGVEYSPSQIKQAATGRGNGAKGEVHMMVHRLLNLTAARAMGNDESDALACALCHAQHAPQATKLAAL